MKTAILWPPNKFFCFCNFWRSFFSPVVITLKKLAFLKLEDTLSVQTNLGKHSLFVWLCVSSIKTGTRRIIPLDGLPSVVRRLRRTIQDSSSRRIMRFVPGSILQTNKQTNNECFPKFVQTDDASSSIKNGHFSGSGN